jgi:hypothetical protein
MLEVHDRADSWLERKDLVLWLQRLEAYDGSGEPLRVYFRSWQKLIRRQRVLLLRAVGWELEQLGLLLPPLRRSLLVPSRHSEGFRLLADLLENLDPERLRWVVEQGEARRRALEKEEQTSAAAPSAPEKGGGGAAVEVVPRPSSSCDILLRLSPLPFGYPEAFGPGPEPLSLGLPELGLLLLLGLFSTASSLKFWRRAVAALETSVSEAGRRWWQLRYC